MPHVKHIRLSTAATPGSLTRSHAWSVGTLFRTFCQTWVARNRKRNYGRIVVKRLLTHGIRMSYHSWKDKIDYNLYFDRQPPGLLFLVSNHRHMSSYLLWLVL